ncbi:hypothetical protein AHAS_Ahas20G0062600 [Arachis hypogaea]
MVVRKAIEEANIPFTYISANLFVSYFAGSLSQMGSFVPPREKLLIFATLVAKKLLKTKVKAYILDFKLAFEHFCIHAGGRAVLDELKKNLQLSLWHELAYT